MSKGSRRITFRVNDDEYNQLIFNLKRSSCKTFSAYIRKMVLDGYVINLQVPELKEMVGQLKRISNGINQIAKIANSTGKIYEMDIKHIQDNQEEIWKMLREILQTLSKIS